MAHGLYHTGDVASIDEDGYLTYVGRTDDVFKSSDYRISPFELESVLIEHPAVAEAAVVPAPDPLRLSVPKAYVVLAAGASRCGDGARTILGYCREPWPRTSASAGSSSPSCPRPSAARSAGSSCAGPRTSAAGERGAQRIPRGGFRKFIAGDGCGSAQRRPRSGLAATARPAARAGRPRRKQCRGRPPSHPAQRATLVRWPSGLMPPST